jgi:multiple sugar transport system permease protein
LSTSNSTPEELSFGGRDLVKATKTTSISPRKWNPGYWFVMPACVVLFIVVVYPSLYSLVVSLLRWNLTDPSMGRRFVGLSNYISALKDSEFLQASVNTVVFVVGCVAIEFCLGMLLAIPLSREIPTVGVLRALLIIPTMVAPIVAGLVWRYMYFPGYGIVPYVLQTMGIPIGRGLLAEKATALFSVMMVDIWEWTPFVTLVLVAGLQSLPTEPMEAAGIDGASKLQMFRYITLPMMRPTILTVLLIRTMDCVKVFDLIYVLTRGGPGNATMTASFYAYLEGLNFFNVGYAAALSWLILLVVMIFSRFYVKVAYGDEEM